MPARWLRVTTTSPSDELRALLAEGLVACGASAVEERGDELVSYLPADAGRSASLAARAAELRGALREVLGTEPPQLLLDEVPEEDWLARWRAGLAPRAIGERLVVAPTWADVELRPDQLLITIDPQMAFGTGEHASTRGVLRLMQHALRGGERLLDVGTGSAILAIAAARLGAAHVTAVESDPDAMENAAENIARNAVADRIALRCDIVDEPFLLTAGEAAFDGILANVLSGILRPLLRAFRHALAPGGWAILSGILTTEADTMRAAAAEAGFSIEAEDVEEEWWTVLLRRS